MVPEALPRGTTLGGRYVLGDLLGRGGWGEVYDGMQADLGRRVAIKVLRTERVFDQDGLARFVREARSAAALGHPNIVQVTDFQASPGAPPFMVMEHLNGATLGAVLRQYGRLPPARACAVAYQILSALETAHRAGIVHRDVKPDNVFLVSTAGHEDFVKLLDFGIAKLASEDSMKLTDASTILGTPSFMAPEQVRGVPVDHRADLYAVGATMYLALTGRLPIEAPGLSALLYAIVHQRPAPLAAHDPSLDPRLCAVVDRALHKDPAGRFASAAEMRAALEPWATTGPRAGWTPSHTPALEPAVAPTERVPEPPRASRVPWIVAGVSVLATVGLAAAFVAHRVPSAASPAPAPSSAALTATPPPSAPEPSPPPPAEVEAGIVPSASASARPRPAAARPRMTGRTPKIVGGGYPSYGAAKGREIASAVMPAVTACHVASEYEPPNHEHTWWRLAVDPSGNVTDVKRLGSEPPIPTFDACMKNALSKTQWPPMPKATEVKLMFTARL